MWDAFNISLLLWIANYAFEAIAIIGLALILNFMFLPGWLQGPVARVALNLLALLLFISFISIGIWEILRHLS